jgi:S1-C subfamily serine protease
MKRLFLLVLFFILSLSTSYALDENEAKKKYLKGDLENLEGIWIDNRNSIFVIYKEGNTYVQRSIRHDNPKVYSGSQTGTYRGSSGSVFYGNSYYTFWRYEGFFQDKLVKYEKPCNATVVLTSFFKYRWKCFDVNRTATKIYPETKQAAKKEKPKKKKKKAKGASGTAFFITDKGHLLTNNHVIKVCNDNSKIVYNGKNIPAKVLAKDALLDLALLKVDLMRTKFIHLSNDPPKKLQRIIAAGYPLGKSLSDDLKFTSGIISSLKGLNDDSTLIQIDAALNKGNSGGPIIDEESGELVAVAVAGLDKSTTEAVNFGIKTNSVKNFLDANQLEVAVPSFFSFGVDAADILEKATVYTYCKND